MEARRRRRVLDVVTAVCAVAGLTLVIVGAAPAEEPRRAEQAAAADQEVIGPPGPSLSVRATTVAGAAPGPAAGSTTGTPSGSTITGTAAGTEPGAGAGQGAGAGAGAGGGGTIEPAGGAVVGMGFSVPVHLEIPAIGVSTALMELGLNPDGTIEVPPLRAKAPAGWYRQLAAPGEVGPAVVLGHVDTRSDGPAVFYQLRELRPGDEVSVRRADGRTAVFGVDRVEEYAKAQFPSDEVYGAVDRPALRLITCGGTFDRLRRSYRGNVVVFATLRRAG
ncbi:class F sortase [Dactylosporangium sp. NPDC000521]|uniref:class F sortase n=1 Tax=Dactylosporangium sp. NPDC000521 TaxID=3363975 RepID=UPI0036740C14